MPVSTLAFVGFQQKTIVVSRLPLIIAQITLGWIFLMLFSNFKARGLRSILKLSMAVLMEFFHADVDISDILVFAP